MTKKAPLYPHVPKSRTKGGEVQVTKTGNRDWVEEELPFAGATSTQVWWLATIGNKTFQVEVSGCHFPGMPVWKIEEAFANSVAKVSVPCLTEEEKHG